MEMQHFDTGPELIARAGEFLRAREVSHALLLAIANRLTDSRTAPQRRPYLATIEEDDRVIAVAIRTPPNQLLLSHPAPGAVESVVDRIIEDLRARGTVLPGVGGPVGVADVFAERWVRANGGSMRVHMALREFELERVVKVALASGALRPAVADDIELVHAWVHAFIDETELPQADREQATRESVARLVAQQRCWLWCEGDTPCAMAIAGGTPRVPRIGGVYTRPDCRGRGYGSAVVAALSQRLLDHGCWRVTLSTDLANPTSNRIYQAIGYTPVGDSVMLTFAP